MWYTVCPCSFEGKNQGAEIGTERQWAVLRILQELDVTSKWRTSFEAKSGTESALLLAAVRDSLKASKESMSLPL